ncbi:hypothetical protein FIBSPDRAFT_945677 [Athelia psychrophila]|uniref:Uncharacterized protein n=1 Tax=Athelia psychrophila TaxID=1759441 RepID=A0A166TLN0_9AGAM|nr:hypothetical protein FIBSPDRAFT_945677 [Fibularhizoctonia sp. CBS 109695]
MSVWYSDDTREAQAYRRLTSVSSEQLTEDDIAGGACFDAAEKYEQHSTPANIHAAAELLGGLIDECIDHLVKVKGLHWINKDFAKTQARLRIMERLEQSGQFS